MPNIDIELRHAATPLLPAAIIDTRESLPRQLR